MIQALPSSPYTMDMEVNSGHEIDLFEQIFKQLEYKPHQCIQYLVHLLQYYTLYTFILTGAAMAQYAGKHLHEYITKRSEYKEGDVVAGIQQGFLELDQAMQNNAALRDEHAGTTVIAILIKDNILYSVSYQFYLGVPWCPNSWPLEKLYRLMRVTAEQ